MSATKPQVRPDLTVVKLDGEAVIYDERADHTHHLNTTATIVLSLCDGTATVREIAADIAEVFAVPADQVERDVRSLLRDFRRSGLLESGKAREQDPGVQTEAVMATGTAGPRKNQSLKARRNGRAGTTTRGAS